MNETEKNDQALIEEFKEHFQAFWELPKTNGNETETVMEADRREKIAMYEQERLINWLRTLIAQKNKEAVERVIQQMFDRLPDYIDENFPKGFAKDRGDTTVKIMMYLTAMKLALTEHEVKGEENV